MVDAIAAAVEMVLAMFADAVETTVDVVAVVGGRGGTDAQQQRDGDEGQGRACGPSACSTSQDILRDWQRAGRKAG